MPKQVNVMKMMMMIMMWFDDDDDDDDDDFMCFQTELKELHKHDIESKDFEALPADIKHEILTELKDAGRKINWAGINSMPKVSVG